MLLMDINPVAFRLSGIDIYWYGIFYALALLGSWMVATFILRRLRTQNAIVPSKQQFDSFMFWAIVWAVIGSRLGHVLFFEPTYYAEHPIEILLIRNGGLAFHGGFIAVAIFIYYFCRKNNFRIMTMCDILCFSASFGIFIGRLANFFNQELYGKIATVDHAVIFQFVDKMPRYPTQIYESLFEGLLNFIVMLYVWGFTRGKIIGSGVFTFIFCTIYSISRFIIEFYKDVETNFWGLTTGQILSILMFLIGIIILLWTKKVNKNG